MSEAKCKDHNDYWKGIYGSCMACRAEKAESERDALAAKLKSAAENLGDIAMSDCPHEEVCPQSCHVVIAKDAMGRLGYDRPM